MCKKYKYVELVYVIQTRNPPITHESMNKKWDKIAITYSKTFAKKFIRIKICDSLTGKFHFLHDNISYSHTLEIGSQLSKAKNCQYIHIIS